MIKFLEKNFAELLNLLQLSVLFMVDELTHDIVEVIVYCWLLPDAVVDVWLLAQDLNVKILQDICFSFCLDRFEELPLSSLVELTKDNVIKLVGNVNVRSSTKYLCLVRTEWTKHNTVINIFSVGPIICVLLSVSFNRRPQKFQISKARDNPNTFVAR